MLWRLSPMACISSSVEAAAKPLSQKTRMASRSTWARSNALGLAMVTSEEIADEGSGQVAAVDGHAGAGDKCRFFGREISNHAGNIVGGAHAAQGDQAFDHVRMGP